jgi:hypothetical protein
MLASEALNCPQKANPYFLSEIGDYHHLLFTDEEKKARKVK